MLPEITFDGPEPSEEGYYLNKGKYCGMIELVQIVRDSKGELWNTTGRTHYSRWLVNWSKKLNFAK